MNLLTHEWNGNPITQLTTETAIAKFTIPADYARLESTKAYWEALSLDMGIPISKLVIPIKGRASHVQQGTWTHPEIAIDLAQWVSVEFRVWANRALKQLISGEIVVSTAPEPTPLLPPSPQEISELYDLTLGKTDLDPKLVAGAKLNAIAKRYPVLQPEADLAKSMLSISVESELVRPTALGEKLTEITGEPWSAVRVNKLLIERGLQVKNPDEYQVNNLLCGHTEGHSSKPIAVSPSFNKNSPSKIHWVSSAGKDRLNSVPVSTSFTSTTPETPSINPKLNSTSSPDILGRTNTTPSPIHALGRGYGSPFLHSLSCGTGAIATAQSGSKLSFASEKNALAAVLGILISPPSLGAK